MISERDDASVELVSDTKVAGVIYGLQITPQEQEIQ